MPNTPDVTIYTKDFCPYCVRAKRVLAAKQVEFTEINVMYDGDLKREMVDRSKRQTVPQIFVGNVHVGGSDELVELEANGRLDDLLQTEEIAA